MEEIPGEIDSYFGYVSLLCIPVCKKCEDYPEFPSTHPQFSEDWYMDQAKGIQGEGWAISEAGEAFCKKCAEEGSIQHDPYAFSGGNGRMWSLIAILFLLSVVVTTVLLIVD